MKEMLFEKWLYEQKIMYPTIFTDANTPRIIRILAERGLIKTQVIEGKEGV